MNKQPQITQATRRDFISAFGNCYKEKPIEKITVKEISEKAGYSRVTFYNYFKDPYDLLSSVEDEFISRIIAEIGGNIEQHRILEGFLETFDRLVTENELYSQILLNNPHSTGFYERLQERIIPLAMELFGISPDNKRAAYAFEFYIPGVISVMSRWLQRGKDIPMADIAALIKGILQNGLLRQLEYDDRS